MHTDLDTLSANVQQTIHAALTSPSITGFSITDLFEGHADKEVAAIAGFSEPMAAATIIKATFTGALDAIANVYGKIPIGNLTLTDVQIPDAFYMRPGDVATVVALFNDTLGSGRSVTDAHYTYASYQPDVFDNTAEVATSFLVALFAAADTIITRVPYLQGTTL